MDNLKLNIPKMSCDGCINTITKGLNGIGLTNLDFDLNTKMVAISGAGLDEKEILKTLRRLNYPAQVTEC
jgi:copper chaperone CopZ